MKIYYMCGAMVLGLMGSGLLLLSIYVSEESEYVIDEPAAYIEGATPPSIERWEMF
jgi:hypothetical protein